MYPTYPHNVQGLLDSAACEGVPGDMTSLLELLPQILGQNHSLTPEMIQEILAKVGAMKPTAGIPPPARPPNPGMGPTQMAMKVPLESLKPSDLLTESALKASPLAEEGVGKAAFSLTGRPPVATGALGPNITLPTQAPLGNAPTALGNTAIDATQMGKTAMNATKVMAPSAQGLGETMIGGSAAAGAGAEGLGGVAKGMISRLLGSPLARFAGGPAGAALMSALPAHDIGDDSISGGGLSEEDFAQLSPQAQSDLIKGLDTMKTGGPRAVSAPSHNEGPEEAESGPGEPDMDDGGGRNYLKIGPGDTISKLLMGRGVTDPAQLAQLIGDIGRGNGINPDKVEPGQIINMAVPTNLGPAYRYVSPRGAHPQEPQAHTPPLPSSGPSLDMGMPKVSDKMGLSLFPHGMPQFQHVTKMPMKPTPESTLNEDEEGEDPDAVGPVGAVSRRMNKRYRL